MPTASLAILKARWLGAQVAETRVTTAINIHCNRQWLRRQIIRLKWAFTNTSLSSSKDSWPWTKLWIRTFRKPRTDASESSKRNSSKTCSTVSATSLLQIKWRQSLLASQVSKHKLYWWRPPSLKTIQVWMYQSYTGSNKAGLSLKLTTVKPRLRIPKLVSQTDRPFLTNRTCSSKFRCNSPTKLCKPARNKCFCKSMTL